MTIYVEVNNTRYPAVITGRLKDKDWNDRSSKAITLEMTHEEASSIFVDDVDWSIIEEMETQVENSDGLVETTTDVIVYDNSEYSMTGDIIDHRNGTITVKMGKPTAEEILSILIGEV